ncbi:hypothetical protein [Gimesia panareensis]|uniref:hypothetical protein n=1 Tax=Gimesia panareensis TaxID=2527978 RepID=UPI00118B7FC4|nr:hypothetical protein [Gimesia panareensis]QDU49550.1 hypothetical protein Pan110_18880 [Gimesia panareensis]
MTLTMTEKMHCAEFQESELCEQQLYDGLSRFHSMLQTIEVTIKTTQTARAGLQKIFRVRIRHESGEITLTHRGNESETTVDEIVKRAEKAMSRARVRYLTRLSGEI